MYNTQNLTLHETNCMLTSLTAYENLSLYLCIFRERDFVTFFVLIKNSELCITFDLKILNID